MRPFSFEKLDVWQRSRLLTENIYKLSGDFPPEERYGLTSQLRRSAVSVSSNIAEGTSRHSGKDKARFTEIAYGSLMEVLNQLITANDLEFIKESELNEIRPLIEEIGNKLNALYNFQINRTNRTNKQIHQ